MQVFLSKINFYSSLHKSCDGFFGKGNVWLRHTGIENLKQQLAIKSLNNLISFHHGSVNNGRLSQKTMPRRVFCCTSVSKIRFRVEVCDVAV